MLPHAGLDATIQELYTLIQVSAECLPLRFIAYSCLHTLSLFHACPELLICVFFFQWSPGGSGAANGAASAGRTLRAVHCCAVAPINACLVVLPKEARTLSVCSSCNFSAVSVTHGLQTAQNQDKPMMYVDVMHAYSLQGPGGAREACAYKWRRH